MSEQKTPPANASADLPQTVPKAEPNSGPPEDTGPHSSLFYERYAQHFKDSLDSHGVESYTRWGLTMFHALGDEDVGNQLQALGIKPTDEYDFYNQGCLLAGREQWTEALAAFDKAIELAPDFAEACFNRACVLEKKGDLSAARKEWQNYLDEFSISADSSEIKQHLGELVDQA